MNMLPREQTPLSGPEILAVHQGVEHDRILWTKDSSHIIFRSRTSGTSELWSVSSTDGCLTRLTINSGATSPRISPDGRWLSYLSIKSGAKEVWLHPIDAALGTKDIQLTHLHGEINSAAWAPDSQSMTVSCKQYGVYDVYEISLSSGKAKRLTTNQTCDEYYPVYTSDGQEILYVEVSESWEDHKLMQMDRNGDNRKAIAHEIGFFDYRNGRQFGHPLVSPDGTRLLFRSRRNNWINYWQVNLEQEQNPYKPTPLHAEEFEQCAESGSISCGEAAWSPDSRFVAFISNQDGNIQLHLVSRDGGQTTVVAGNEGGVASNPSWSPDGTRLAFLFESFTQPPDVWLVDVHVEKGNITTSAPRQLTSSIPKMVQRKLQAPRKVTFESFDGRMISGYLYRPDRQGDQPGPAIIEVHGGPPDQFRDTLHLVVQYYVQRGYTVLTPNIRGSAGYGKEFEMAIRTGWGVDDLQDLIAAAKFLTDHKIAHPEQIGITGQSYGGFLSMMAACSAPCGVFRASISRSGYADWLSYYQRKDGDTPKLLRHTLGDPEENKDLYRKSSALHRAKEAQTPIFVIDQESDETMPQVDMRLDFVRELNRYDKPVEYKKYRDTGGTYARSHSAANEMLPDMMNYFDKYLRRP